MQDVSHHLVLSYRASIENPTINYMDGITGKYPSLMFIYRFQEILQEYGKQELRELWSVPLPLSEEKKDFFMKVTLERYWNYQGKYLFLSNNCGTESLRHLLAVDDELFDDIGDFTPLQLFKGLSRLDGFAELTDDKDALQAKGLYFPSHKEDLEEALATLREQGLNDRENLKDFLKSTPQERFALYQARDWANADATANRVAVLNLQYVERYMALVYNMNLMKNVAKRVAKEAELQALVEAEVRSFISLLRRPWDVAGDGYGVPATESFNAKFATYLIERKAQMAEQKGSSLEALAKHPKFAKEAHDIETMKNIGKLISTEIARMGSLL